MAGGLSLRNRTFGDRLHRIAAEHTAVAVADEFLGVALAAQAVVVVLAGPAAEEFMLALVLLHKPKCLPVDNAGTARIHQAAVAVAAAPFVVASFAALHSLASSSAGAFAGP